MLIAECEKDFSSWLNNSMPGEQCKYYHGFLAGDGRGSLNKRPRPPAYAHEAWAYALTGVILLTQRRVVENVFSYIATKARKIVPLDPRFPNR